MNVLRWGVHALEKTTPAGLIIAGTALVLACPPIRRRLRLAAVAAARGTLTVTAALHAGMMNLREGMEDLVAEAKDCTAEMTEQSTETCHDFAQAFKRQGRRVAVTATGGVMAFRDELKSIFDEARSEREAALAGAGPDEAVIEPDGLEAPVLEADSVPMPKKRQRSKPL